MPDPISSSSTSSASAAGFDPTLDEASQTCRADAANSSQPEPSANAQPAVARLVSSVPKPAAALPPASRASAPSTADNNAQRTSELSSIDLYAAAGKTASSDSLYGGAALLKGREPKSGFEVEVLSASAQLGLQNEAQVGLQRIGRGTTAGGASIEAFTARANCGIHDDDGSKGFNIGGLATIIGAETTLGSGANSLTLGLAAGVGAAAHIGLRDKDGDGRQEICAKVSVDALTLGACVENPL